MQEFSQDFRQDDDLCNSRIVPAVQINGMENLQKDADSPQAHLKVVNDVEKCLTGETSGDSKL